MFVLNTLAHPVELHGCVPATNWTFDGCDKSDDVAAPVTLTIERGQNEFEDDDTYTLFARLWDDPPGVTIHWQYGC